MTAQAQELLLAQKAALRRLRLLEEQGAGSAMERRELESLKSQVKQRRFDLAAANSPHRRPIGGKMQLPRIPSRYSKSR